MEVILQKKQQQQQPKKNYRRKTQETWMEDGFHPKTDPVNLWFIQIEHCKTGCFSVFFGTS